MINTTEVLQKLRSRYPALEEVSRLIMRGIDIYEGQPYAIRYFDLTDDVVGVASHIGEYQEQILGTSYFDSKSKPDLRWNHYLYFLTSWGKSADAETYGKAKASIERDRGFARKFVLTETELANVLDGRIQKSQVTSLPTDPFSEWTKALEKHDLGFVVDEALHVPEVVRQIVRGDREGLQRAPAAPVLDESERRVVTDSLKRLIVHQFRRYPLRKEYEFGTVNLVTGLNGTGKTSLLESIEYLFCGRVRRSDGAPPKAAVTGVLETSGLEIVTKSTTPAAKLRARHLVWYGKADLRAVTLDNSFGKFNFMDTDAAVHLTVEQSQERINADLAQLLLGAEAAKALDRFERLQRALFETQRDFERDIQIRDQRRLDASARLQQMRNIPQESDQIFKQLTETLASVGWAKTLSTKTESELLASELQSALVNIGILKGVDSAILRDPSRLATDQAELARLQKQLKEIQNHTHSLDEREAGLKRSMRAIEARINALNQLIPMLDANIGEIAKELDSKKQRLVTLTSALVVAEPAARHFVADKKQGGMVLLQLIDIHAKDVEERAASLNDARRSLEAFERAQTVLTNLEQQLRTIATRIVEHTHDDTHCPLCSTRFSKNDLEGRLRDTSQPLAAVESQRLRLRAQEAEDGHKQAVTVLQALRSLAQYQGLVVNNRTTVHAVLTRIAADRDDLAKVQSEVDALNQRVQEQEKKGWTLDRLRELARAAELSPSDLNRESAGGVASSLAEQRKEQSAKLTTTLQEREQLSDQIAQLAAARSIQSRKLSEVDAAITSQAKVVAQVARTVDSLKHQFNQTTMFSDLEFEARLREAHALAIRLSTANARESELSKAIKRESKLLGDVTAEIGALRVQAARIDVARGVIANLIERQSSQALTNRVLRENGKEIAATFAKIHAPSEFDVDVGEEGLRIARRVTKVNVGLNEMSSGQRSAFTLSLFLAMNGRLRTGPRVMIFDDPVAHVDDINTLSFLDHLRDIALGGDRQLFFATADSKLATLFGRKFRFMGERYREIELLRE